MALPQPALRSSVRPHVHVAGERCPYCNQPIPNEKAAEIRARVKADEQKRTDVVTARLTQQFVQEREQARAAAREEGRKAAEAVAKERLLQAEKQKAEAVTQYNALKISHDKEIGKRVNEVRKSMESAKSDALKAQNARHFAETQKLTVKIQEVQRQLEKKTADELGEGAEINLFDALKGEFPDDRIKRVPKGIAGADIVHSVIHNGKECGTIIYDSKNRKAWRDEYVTKLREDKTAANAEHAILSALKFPADAYQLQLRDGVIIANPARVVVLAEILRSHIVRTHGLRMSNKEREKKKGELYAFITSERFGQHLDSIETQTEKMLGIDVDEQKAHTSVWAKRGRLIKDVQKAHGNLSADIDRIVGIATDAEE